MGNSHTTETVPLPGATVYAACQSSNLVNSANGNQGIQGGGMGSDGASQITAATAYDCCVACQQSVDTGGTCRWPYFFNGYCGLISSGTCDPGQLFSGDYDQTNSLTSPATGYTMSNGPCGAVANGGDVEF
ncbi:MAG: hypothetical protein Q9195_002979 [Heterodermia aff. obscurata]